MLCYRCYYTPGVRKQYPVTSKYSRGGNGTLPANHVGRLPEPTDTLTGTPEREAVLADRAARGLSLFHPNDAVRE